MNFQRIRGRLFGQLRHNHVSTALNPFERRALVFTKEKARQTELRLNNARSPQAIEVILPDGSRKAGTAGTTTPLEIAQGTGRLEGNVDVVASQH